MAKPKKPVTPIVDRTTTVDIKDVGTTKVEVADEAKKKL